MFTPVEDLAPGREAAFIGRRSDGQRTLADRLAVAYVCAYVVVHLQPFVLVRELPGSAAWAGLPALGVTTLILMPADRLRRIPVSFSVCALAVWMSISLTWAYDRGDTNFTVRSEVPSLILLCMVTGAMRRGDVARTLLRLFVGIGAWSLFASLTMPESRVAYLEFGSVLEVQDGWRGTFTHKNLHGVFAVLGLTTVLAFARRGPGRWAMIVLFVVLVLGTRSATAASGALIVLLVWSWLTWLGRLSNPTSRVFAKLASVALMVIAVSSTLALLPTLVGVYGKDLTFSGRTQIWAASLDTIRERPLTGQGAGGVWLGEFNPLTNDLYRRIGFPAAHAHNGALDVLLALGVVGLVLYGCLMLATVHRAIAALGRPADALFGRWGVVSVAALFVMALSEPLFQGGFVGYVAIVWTALASTNARADSSSAGSV